MKPLTVLHVPRTGGASRRDALGKCANVYMPPHEYRLSQVPMDRVPAIFLRDPVERYLSGYDYLLAHGNRAVVKNPGSKWYSDTDFMELWPSAEALALDLDVAWPVIQQQSLVFRPAVWWLDFARHDLFVGRQEHLAEDFARLCYLTNTTPAPLAHTNGVPRSSTLSDGARAIVRMRYAADYEWWMQAQPR